MIATHLPTHPLMHLPMHQPGPGTPWQASTAAHLVLDDPPSGSGLVLTVGQRLVLRFRPRLGVSRWRVVAHPDHLVPLAHETPELWSLAFATPTPPAPAWLRLERYSPGSVHESRELLVVVEPCAGGAVQR